GAGVGRAEGGDAAAAVPGIQDGRAPAFGQVPPQTGCQHESRLVEQDQGGTARRGLPHDARELLPEPAGDLIVVARAGPALWLLAGPAQARAEEAADVIGVVGDAEVPADQLADPGRGPDLACPPP